MHCGPFGSSRKLAAHAAGLPCPTSSPSPPPNCCASTAGANSLRSRWRATSSTGSRRLNPSINAFIIVDREGALAAAKASEARWQKGEPIGLVDGIGATVKDNVWLKGFPSRRGSLTSDPAPIKADAPAVGAAARAGRRHPRQDDAAGIRLDRRVPLAAHRHHAQSLEARPHARRLVRRRCGGSAARSRPSAYRHRRRRLDPHPGRFHRRVRHQAELRPRRRVSGLAVQHPGACRPADAHRHRRRADALGDRRAGRARHGGMEHADARLPRRPRRRRARPARRLEPAARLRARSSIRKSRPRRRRPRRPLPIWARSSRRPTPAFPTLTNDHDVVGRGLGDDRRRQAAESDRAKMDPGFRAMADLGKGYSLADYLAAFTARADIANAMVRFHETYDLLLTPQMPIPALEAGLVTPADGSYGDELDQLVALHLSVQPDPAACRIRAVRLLLRRPADRLADRRDRHGAIISCCAPPARSKAPIRGQPWTPRDKVDPFQTGIANRLGVRSGFPHKQTAAVGERSPQRIPWRGNAHGEDQHQWQSARRAGRA